MIRWSHAAPLRLGERWVVPVVATECAGVPHATGAGFWGRKGVRAVLIRGPAGWRGVPMPGADEAECAVDDLIARVPGLRAALAAIDAGGI